ncbi:MAG: hypothetical protein LBB23_01120 [Rickettsiales bacterium]|nr:hypothetical protein [Rickettsiales bacterium]
MLILGISSAATASTIPNHISDSIQRAQQQLMEDEIRTREVKNIKAQSPFITGQPKQQDKTSPATPGRCVEIKTIIFGGNTILSNRQVRRITRQYENRCLQVEEINALLNEITNKYIDKGYATSRAYMEMPQKRLREGILDIYLIEGTINNIEGLDLSEQITAFPLLTGTILNIRDIEQGLDQINRLGSNKATMDIKAAPGGASSNIEIKNAPLGRSNIGATIDNFGMDSTGQWRSGIRFSEDDLLGLNDQINISLSHSIVPDFGNRLTRSATLGLSVPMGYWTMRGGVS